MRTNVAQRSGQCRSLLYYRTDKIVLGLSILIATLLGSGCRSAPGGQRTFQPIPAEPAAPAITPNATQPHRSQPASDTRRTALPAGCHGPTRELNGRRLLAYLVGVGQYQKEVIPDLRGPTHDIAQMKRLLSGPGGYGFPEENVCILQDGMATSAAFVEGFQRSLIDRAQPGDVVVFYFSGHGSQARDLDGDEPDGWDETLLLHDARVGEIQDFTDDRLHTLLETLHAKTRNITMILDSCNSGTVNKDGDSIARLMPPQADASVSVSTTAPSEGDGDEVWRSKDLEGLVVLGAAADGTSAIERNGRGIFTDGLLEVLQQAGAGRLSWQQVARRLPPILAAQSRQVPLFQGALDREVFGVSLRARPLALEVAEIQAGTILLKGAPLPGWSEGALVRAYDPATPSQAFGSPAAATALLEVLSVEGLEVRARRADVPTPNGRTLQLGDLAVLTQPGITSSQLGLRIRPPQRPGGVPSPRAQAILNAIQADSFAKNAIRLSGPDLPWELIQSASGALQLVGPEGRIRNTFAQNTATDAQLESKQALKSLRNHARQLALLQLRGSGGTDLSSGTSLKVEVEPLPDAKQLPCVRGQSPILSTQADVIQLPLCMRWRVKVTVVDAPYPLLIGGVILSNDGEMKGFPEAGGQQPVPVGSSYTTYFNLRAEPPLEVLDHVMVFGTPESERVAWADFTTIEATLQHKGGSSLQGFIADLLGLDSKGQNIEEPKSSWASSYLGVQVYANSRFLTPAQELSDDGLKKEFTIPNHAFDLRPYLPDDPSSALHRVLQTEYALSRAGGEDGYPYRSHDWSLPTDEANLLKGIDCSRAIWYAFTRSGLPFNRENRYLPTAQMADPQGWMKDEFERCDADSIPRIGDVLVYRDADRNIGHTVMVIDAERRIAWGSHGWDGNMKEGLEPDRGVEYQRIKYKKDWKKWDSQNMRQVACWRHRQFLRDWEHPGRQPGVMALEHSCRSDRCK